MLPPIPRDLIEALEAAYPECSPHPHESYQDLMFRAGQASVMRHLRRVFDEQNETVLAPQDPLNVST